MTIIAWPFIIASRLATNLSAQPAVDAVLFWLAEHRARGVAIQWLFTSRQPWTSLRIRPTTLPSSPCIALMSEPASLAYASPLSVVFHTLFHGEPRTSRQQVNSGDCTQFAHVFRHMMSQDIPFRAPRAERASNIPPPGLAACSAVSSRSSDGSHPVRALRPG